MARTPSRGHAAYGTTGVKRSRGPLRQFRQHQPGAGPVTAGGGDLLTRGWLWDRSCAWVGFVACRFAISVKQSWLALQISTVAAQDAAARAFHDAMPRREDVA